MRTLSILSLAIAAALGGCVIIATPDTGDFSVHTPFSDSAVKGNGSTAIDKRAVADLTGLDVNGPINVEVRVGERASLEVEADSNLLPMIRTDASGDMLRIWIDGHLRTEGPLRVRYTVQKLEHIDSSGSGSLTVAGLNGGPLHLQSSGSGQKQISGRVTVFDAEVNGSGSVHAEGLQATQANVRVNGSGRLNLGLVQGGTFAARLHGSGGLRASGRVQRLDASVHGSGSADLIGLTAASGDLNAYGSGGITAKVTDSVSAQTTGSGGITVYGNPAQRSLNGKHISLVN